MPRSQLAITVATALLTLIAQVPSGVLATSLPAECSETTGVVTCTYTSGDNLFTVPAGVTSVHAKAAGGNGGSSTTNLGWNGDHGLGAMVVGDLSVNPGAVLHAIVGGNARSNGLGGYNGGGPGGSASTWCIPGGGGGASDIRTDATLASRVLVAAGGGGGGCAGDDVSGVRLLDSTAGGSAAGAGRPFASDANWFSGVGGGAGCDPSTVNCTNGGAAALGGGIYVSPGASGGLGVGGAGSGLTGLGGGGGGGFWGGGGGGGGEPGALPNPPGPGGGGGGGSNLVPPGGSIGFDPAGPEVEISYTVPAGFNVASAASTGTTSMTVAFDAAPDASQAASLANYSVPGLTLSGTPVLVGNIVTLTTTTQAAQIYTVTVSNVTRAADALSLTTNAATFTGTQPTSRVTADPTSLDLGSARVGIVSSSSQVTLTAEGVDLGQIAIIGANASDFAIDDDHCSNRNVTSSCVFHVTFTPSARGLRSATVEIPDDLSDGDQTVPLSGVGVAPIGSVTPSSLDFGTLDIGTRSDHQTVTVTNTTTDVGQTLTIESSTVTGSNPSDFAISGGTCGTGIVNLSPGAHCTLEINFEPTAAGHRSATLRITDNGLGSPHDVTLAGMGTTPSADLAVSIAASSTLVKTRQKLTYTITVSNAGPSTSMNVVVSDTLSSQSTFVSATISQGSCVTPGIGISGVVSCSLASLASGSSQPIQIVVAVIAKKGSVTNTVTVSAATADPNLADNTASVTTHVK